MKAILGPVVALLLFLPACSNQEREDEQGWTRISPQELGSRLAEQDLFLVNVHIPYEGQIPGTDANIAYDEIVDHLDELPSDTSDLVIYCRSGNMSAQAAQDLVDAGVTGFFELEGGYTAWQAAGLPFEAP